MRCSVRSLQCLLFALYVSAPLFACMFPLFAVHAEEMGADLPLGEIPVSFQPDLFTGALVGALPLEIPAGRNGMQPQLALTYASSHGNGWVGTGWKLEIGAIERQTRWGVLYTPTTAEEQAGKVYALHLNGVTTELIQDAGDPTRYRAKVEHGFMRFKKLIDGWEVTDTKGTKYWFGTQAATRIQNPDGTMIFKWCLERVEDRDGNYWIATYQGDGATNQRYLDHLGYTGNSVTGAPTTNTVKFYLEPRPDMPDMYTSNFLVKTAKRLKTIEVKANGALVRAYTFAYSASASSADSLLASVHQVGRDASIDAGSGAVAGGTALPVLSLGYHPGPQSFTDGAVWASSWCSGASLYRPVDVNGDGKQDLWCFNSSNGAQALAVSNGDGSLTAWGNPPTCYQGAIPPADVTGDGLQDIWCYSVQMVTYPPPIYVIPVTRWYVTPSTPSGNYTPLAIWLGPLSDYHGHSYQMRGLDFNGDGKDDLGSLREGLIYSPLLMC